MGVGLDLLKDPLPYVQSLVRARDFGGGRHLERDLPGLRTLERAQHDEDEVAVLVGPDGAGCVRATVPHPVHMVQDRYGERTQKKVALGEQLVWVRCPKLKF